MLPRDLGHLFDADLGNDGLGRIKVCIAHGRDICDYRDFMSSEIRELRDRKICGNREYHPMSDPQHNLRIWLQQELAKRPHGTKSQLAQFIGARPDAVTRMANIDPKKETRAIEAHELELMRQFFDQDGATAAPIRGSDEIRKVLERIDGLKPDNVTVLLSAIHGFQRANLAQPEQARPDDQSEPATPRRESTPSR
ncbi:hypothetical protein [Mesorhizobium sp. M0578]|uniref:hypothetical protein n=1 Tax=unclassified Mesorhizobium TaxID=325217 RepID=UPI00333D9A38